VPKMTAKHRQKKHIFRDFWGQFSPQKPSRERKKNTPIIFYVIILSQKAQNVNKTDCFLHIYEVHKKLFFNFGFSRKQDDFLASKKHYPLMPSEHILWVNIIYCYD